MLGFFTFIIKNMILTGSYQNQIFKEPLSSEEEEYHIKELLNGNKLSREILIEHNLRLVAHIVKKYSDKMDNVDDLISIGTIGLIKGIDSFSKSNGAKITTYCARCIENEILMHFRNDKKNSKNVSLDESIGFDKEGNEITIVDVLKTSNPDYIDSINTKDDIVKLNKYINVLSDREKKIIIKRYGLYGEKEITQKKVADELNISRSYVSRIEKRAISKILKEFIKSNKTLWLLCFDYENGDKTEEIRNGGYMNINRDYYLNHLFCLEQVLLHMIYYAYLLIIWWHFKNGLTMVKKIIDLYEKSW